MAVESPEWRQEPNTFQRELLHSDTSWSHGNWQNGTPVYHSEPGFYQLNFPELYVRSDSPGLHEEFLSSSFDESYPVHSESSKGPEILHSNIFASSDDQKESDGAKHLRTSPSDFRYPARTPQGVRDAGNDAGISPASTENEQKYHAGIKKRKCSECDEVFRNLQDLERHTKASSHKSWRCEETGCGKMYSRRDTFVRHQAKHKENSFNCQFCRRSGRNKPFKRKDHLREHIRNCHSKGSDTPRFVQNQELKQAFLTSDSTSSDVQSFSHLVDDLTAESQSAYILWDDSLDNKFCTLEQQNAMKTIVKSLGTVLGSRHQGLIGNLEDKLTTLSGEKMESLAESMAGVAFAGTLGCEFSCSKE